MITEYRMNTTGMGAEWIADADAAWEKLPREIHLTERPGGASVVSHVETALGGLYAATYEYERRDADTCTVYLKRMECVMPPRPPQIRGFSDDRRLPMMDRWGFSATLEAEQRRKEWAEDAL